MFRRIVIAVTTCVMVAVGLVLAGPSTVAAQEAPQDSGPVWLTVSAGGFHTCGIRTGHSLWCWGDNRYGQLGVGDTKKRAVPTQVGTGTDWVGLVAGNAHTCATRTDATLWCWGLNRDGQLGIGSKNLKRTTPTRVGSGADWADVSAAGLAHTCGIRTDHTLWCWGFNSSGQLGLGDTATRTAPTQVGTGADWAKLSAGHRQTCGTRTDHTLWCWGDNTFGQLGLGDTANRTAPTQVGIATDWADVSSGARHTCATRTDHTLWCWGDNTFGQLGLGDQAARLVPTLV